MKPDWCANPLQSPPPEQLRDAIAWMQGVAKTTRQRAKAIRQAQREAEAATLPVASEEA